MSLFNTDRPSLFSSRGDYNGQPAKTRARGGGQGRRAGRGAERRPFFAKEQRRARRRMMAVAVEVMEGEGEDGGGPTRQNEVHAAANSDPRLP